MKIQFISPVSNEEILLPRLIQSLLAQSDKNWKLLIVDNSSTDSTLTIARHWETVDPRIKVVALNERKSNVFESWKAALNICFESTDCEYIQITPGDDYLFNHDYVELALQTLAKDHVNGLVPHFKYKSRNVVLNRIGYRSLFKDWNNVHLIFGIFKISDMHTATDKLFKLDHLTNTFDWWLSYFLIEHAPSYSPQTIFYRESNRGQIPNMNTIVIRPILDLSILKPLRRIFALRHPIRNYIKATNINFQHYILIRGSIGSKDRFRLLIAFLLKIIKVY